MRFCQVRPHVVALPQCDFKPLLQMSFGFAHLSSPSWIVAGPGESNARRPAMGRWTQELECDAAQAAAAPLTGRVLSYKVLSKRLPKALLAHPNARTASPGCSGVVLFSLSFERQVMDVRLSAAGSGLPSSCAEERGLGGAPRLHSGPVEVQALRPRHAPLPKNLELCQLIAPTRSLV